MYWERIKKYTEIFQYVWSMQAEKKYVKGQIKAKPIPQLWSTFVQAWILLGLVLFCMRKRNILEAECIYPGVRLIRFDLGSNTVDKHISLNKLLRFRISSKLSQILQGSAAFWLILHLRASPGVANTKGASMHSWHPCKTSREESLLCSRAEMLFPGCH